jgi:hypothetical protein
VLSACQNTGTFSQLNRTYGLGPGMYGDGVGVGAGVMGGGGVGNGCVHETAQDTGFFTFLGSHFLSTRP